MSLAETAKLAVDIGFKSNASSVIGGVNRQLAGLDARSGQIKHGFATLGTGIGTAIRNGSIIAIGAIGALSVAVGQMVKEGQEAQRVELVYAKALANSGKVSAEYVGILNAQQAALMNLAGVDDELIKAEQTKLIQMGLTGKQVADLTPLILDMSKATGKDLLTSTLAVGKAVNGNVAGLQRYGIVVDKAKAKVDPFGAVIDALNKKFAGTTQALSGTLEARLGAFREGLANIREEAGIKLLPALTRITDVMGRAVVPAFGKFVDRIMPGITAGIDDFARALEGGGAERAIAGISDALGTMIDLLKLAAAPVKAIVGAFMSLPKEVQTIIIGGLAVNKLSGGLIGKGIGEIAGGVAGGVFQRGGSPANPLYVADVAGGIGGKGGVVGAGGGLVGILKTAGALAVAGLALGKLVDQFGTFRSEGAAGAETLRQQTASGVPQLSLADAKAALRATQEQLGNPINDLALKLSGTFDQVKATEQALLDRIKVLEGGTTGGGRGDKSTADEVKRLGARMADMDGVIERAVARGFTPTKTGIIATMEKNVRATKSGDDRTIDRLGSLDTAVRGTTATIKNKDFSPTFNPTISVYTGFTISVRNIAVAQRVASKYNIKTGKGGGGRML